MRSSALTRGIAALTVGAATAAAALTVGADGANAATPPYEPDGHAVGTITFYDKTGNAITSGSTQVPFASYAVGSTAPRSGDTKAGLAFANPDPNSSPYKWYSHGVGTFTSFPTTSAPQSINSQTTPVYSASDSDQTIEQFESGATHYSGTGYTNMVQIRLYTANAGGQVTTTYDDADLLIDPAAHTWTEVYPTNAGGGTTPPTTNHATSISIAGPSVVRYGANATITGNLRDTTAGKGLARASVKLYERANPKAAVRLVGTVSSSSTGALSKSVRLTGGEQFQWVYGGASGHRAASSAYRAVGVSTAVSIAVDHSTIKHGGTATFYGSSVPATSGTRIYLQQLIRGRWHNVASGVQKRQKLPNRRTTVGFRISRRFTKKGSYTFRAYKPATSTLRGSLSRPITEHVK